MFSLNFGLSVLIVVSFIIVYIIFSKFFWKPIAGIINDREEMIKNDIESAKKALSDAENNKRLSEEILFNTRKEADNIVIEARRKAERIKADVIQTAKIESSFIIDHAKKKAELEKLKVIDNLKNDIAGLTMLSTEKVLHRLITSEEQRNLINAIVKTMVE